MALYDYQCLKCRNKIEVNHPMNENPIIYCLNGECHGEMKKTISLGSFELKGGGWASELYTKPKKD